MSVGEIVGVAHHAETLHIPHHTPRERAFLHALRCLARITLHDLCAAGAPRESFAEFAVVAGWRRAHTAALEGLMQHRPRWIARAVAHMARFNARLSLPPRAPQRVARPPATARWQAAAAEPSGAGGENSLVKGAEKGAGADRTFVVDGRPTSVAQLLAELAENALDPEWCPTVSRALWPGLMVLSRGEAYE
jgi:hypothetical protein